jgi:exosortase family protein XrtF
MSTFSFQEFKPSVFFLLKFLALYIAGNVVYGLAVEAYYPGVDNATVWVTRQTAYLLTQTGWESQVVEQTQKARALITHDHHTVISVFEGCNGINVMIVFVAFLISFGPITRKLVWFIPAGILIIHLANLARIYFLFLVSLYQPSYLYFIHKYFFTAALYVIVFALWFIWLRLNKAKNESKV